MSPFRWKIEAFSLQFSDVSCASRGVYYVGTLRVEASLLGDRCVKPLKAIPPLKLNGKLHATDSAKATAVELSIQVCF